MNNKTEGGKAQGPPNQYRVGSGFPTSMNAVSFSYEARSPKTAPVHLLANVSFTVCSGEITSLIGESGSGKSTLVNLIAGLLQPQSGTITVPQRVSHLPQEDLLLPFRTAWQNACLAAELRGLLSEVVLEDARSLLDIMKLAVAADSLPQQLSGGMKRRVALARQLLPPADTYLLDEPLGEQDRRMREALEELLFQRFRGARSSALIVTHDLDSAVALSDTILVLDSHGTVRRVWHCPQEFLGSPAQRRRHPQFAQTVSDVWREMWRALGNE